MSSNDKTENRRTQLGAWFEQSPGNSLLALEAQALRALWPTLFSRVAVQLGCVGSIDLLADCNAQVRAVLDLPSVSGTSALTAGRVHALPEALPFDGRSVDLMLLSHTLDFADDPHQVLREVSRVLTPEGHVLILGFNPFSLWGLWRLVRRRNSAPWCGHFLQLSRIKDWLKLLDFELVRGNMLYYRPPLTSEAAMHRLRFLDKAGDRWWPLAGAVYLLLAKKRVAGMTPLRPEWRSASAFGRAVARPALRVIRGG